MAEKSKRRKNPWWKSAIAIYLIYPLVVGLVIFVLTRIWPEKPQPPEPAPPDKNVSPIEYESKGEELSVIIKHIEGETDYDVIAGRKAEEFRVYGSFKGDDWIQILKKVGNAYDKQLQLDIDEKNKKITIRLKSPEKTKK